MIPHPVGILEVSAAKHDLAEPLLRNHVLTHQIVPAKAIRILPSIGRRIRGQDHVVAFVLDTSGEAESRVIARRDHKTHHYLGLINASEIIETAATNSANDRSLD